MAELRAYADLGEAYRAAGRYRDAIAVYEQIWPRLVSLGRDDTITAVTWLNNWGIAAGQAGRPLEAGKLLRRSMEIHRADASDAAVSPMVMTNYAQQLYDLAQVEEARAYAETAYREALRAGDEIIVNQTLLRLARIYRAQHNYARATAVLDEVEPRLHRALPPSHYAFGSLALERALIAKEQGDTERAVAFINDGINLLNTSAKVGKAGGAKSAVAAQRSCITRACRRAVACRRARCERDRGAAGARGAARRFLELEWPRVPRARARSERRGKGSGGACGSARGLGAIAQGTRSTAPGYPCGGGAESIGR